jgi:AcrR family transcriptional regulator
VARVTREESKARTRDRLLSEAQRLFRERGYAATSLEQIADAAEVTKGAIYGHFSSKEDLLLSAIEASPTMDFGPAMFDQSRPLRDRLAEFGRDVAVADFMLDRQNLAVHLEFLAALLRKPDARQRYAADLGHRLAELAAADDEEPGPGVTREEAWAIGHALLAGLQINRCVAPEIFTPALFEHAFGMLAALYPDNSASATTHD